MHTMEYHITYILGGIELKKLISLVLAMALSVSLVIVSASAANQGEYAAQTLYEKGLFKGTGTDANGNPIFDLDATPTRGQAVIMLVRLLGKEEEAKTTAWTAKFTDVSDKMKPYVQYAYTNGLASGTSETTFSPSKTITAPQYVTFALRALGYNTPTDFTVSTACEFATKIGLLSGEYSNKTTDFDRGDVAMVSLGVLMTPTKDGVSLEDKTSTTAITQEEFTTNFRKFGDARSETRDDGTTIIHITLAYQKSDMRDFFNRFQSLNLVTQKSYLDNLVLRYVEDNNCAYDFSVIMGTFQEAAYLAHPFVDGETHQIQNYYIADPNSFAAEV